MKERGGDPLSGDMGETTTESITEKEVSDEEQVTSPVDLNDLEMGVEIKPVKGGKLNKKKSASSKCRKGT